MGGRHIVTEPMRRRHLPAVMRIERRAHPKPWSLGVFTSELAQGDARYYLVLKVDGKVAGYGGLMFAADEAHVTNIAIAPTVRRQGLGAAPAGGVGPGGGAAPVRGDDPRSTDG